MAWTFGFGFEFMLPVPDYDLRIPLTFRGTYNPGLGDTAGDRIRTLECAPGGGACRIQKLDFISEWEWQAAVTVGLSWYFK